MKSGSVSFKDKGTQPLWKNDRNDSHAKGFMSRPPEENRSAGVAIEKAFML
jgi:hypothetical protein